MPTKFSPEYHRNIRAPQEWTMRYYNSKDMAISHCLKAQFEAHCASFGARVVGTHMCVWLVFDTDEEWMQFKLSHDWAGYEIRA